jgi:hypothetical protein
MVLPFTMVGTGWQIQDQYQGFRANESPADIAGKLANSTWSDEELRNTFVLATSRFDATNFAIWADQPNMKYELYGPGSQYDSNLAPEGTQWIVSIGDVGAVGDFAEVIEGEGYKLYKLKG